MNTAMSPAQTLSSKPSCLWKEIDCQTKNYNLLCEVLKVFGRYFEQKMPDIKEQTRYDVCLYKVQEQAKLIYADRSQNNCSVRGGHVYWEGA